MPEYYSSGRTPQRNSNSRNRSAQQRGRRPVKRRKRRPQPRFYVMVAVVVIVLIAALALVLSLGQGNTDAVQPQATPTPAANSSGMSNATVSSYLPAEDETASAEPDASSAADAQDGGTSSLAELLADESADISNLSEAGMVQVSDLSINTSLPEEWMNVLLLGTDERTLTESPRTDTMIICSINTSTGEVKLTSIMRDTAVQYDDLGEYNGTYRINSANFFGGPEYAVKTVNELLNMNIQYYVTVNFFGFQRIAQALGGIEVNITEAEMNEINKKAVNQAWIAYYAGIEEPDQINEYLETYGPNTHLNGRQTLAYARLRSLDSDFSRAERQRTVLIKLLEKLKEKNALEIVSLINTFAGDVETNLDLNTIAEIAMTVLNSSLGDVETLRIPVNGTYVEEKRNNQSMLYDADWTVNSRELYSFIYS